MVKEIAASSVIQTNETKYISNAIQSITKLTQQNSAESEELASASEEIANQAEQLSEIAHFFKTDTKNRKIILTPHSIEKRPKEHYKSA